MRREEGGSSKGHINSCEHILWGFLKGPSRTRPNPIRKISNSQEREITPHENYLFNLRKLPKAQKGGKPILIFQFHLGGKAPTENIPGSNIRALETSLSWEWNTQFFFLFRRLEWGPNNESERESESEKMNTKRSERDRERRENIWRGLGVGEPTALFSVS